MTNYNTSNPDSPKPEAILNHIHEEIAMVIPDYAQYLILQIRLNDLGQIFYSIDDVCPLEKSQKIADIIRHNGELLNIPVTTEEIE